MKNRWFVLIVLVIILLGAFLCLWYYKNRSVVTPIQNPISARVFSFDDQVWHKTFTWIETGKGVDGDPAQFTLDLTRNQNTLTGDHCWYAGSGSFLDCDATGEHPKQSIKGTITGNTALITVESYRDDYIMHVRLSWGAELPPCAIKWEYSVEEKELHDINDILPLTRILSCKEK